MQLSEPSESERLNQDLHGDVRLPGQPVPTRTMYLFNPVLEQNYLKNPSYFEQLYFNLVTKLFEWRRNASDNDLPKQQKVLDFCLRTTCTLCNLEKYQNYYHVGILVYNEMGKFQHMLGNYFKAMDFYEIALEACEKFHNYQNISILHFNYAFLAL